MCQISFIIPAERDRVSHLNQVINIFLKPENLSSKIHTIINLIIEESLMNTIAYGLDGDPMHEFNVTVTVSKNDVIIKIIDDGKEFNPLAMPHLCRSQLPPEKEVGLGIHLIRNIMNTISYSRVDGKNITEVMVFL